MYTLLVFTLTYLLTCNCLAQKDEEGPHICGLGRQWLESVLVSTDVTGKGFHREMVTAVDFSPDGPDVLQALLVHNLPRGVYVDPYQVASLSGDSHPQILLDSAIDLEAPAHRTGGFAALVFAPLVGKGSRLLRTSVPIHCRYHEPSFGKDKSVHIDIGPPDLLLRSGTCTDGSDLTPYAVVDAPCTAANSSICSWVQIQPHQAPSRARLQIPVGDGSLAVRVTCGTLLVTVVCTVVLSLHIWKHGVLKQRL